MQCKLCLNEVDKLQRSHIIPHAFFRPAMPKGEAAVIISSDANQEPSNSTETHDENLFCSGCEKYLNVSYERYTISVLKGGGSAKVNKKGRCVQFKCVDCKKVYLFLLSIFWRMAIAQGTFYEKVIFTPDFKEEARKALLHGSVLDKNYRFFIERLTFNHPSLSNPDVLSRQIIISPFYRNEEGHVSFHFSGLGYFFSFVVAHHSLFVNDLSQVKPYKEKISAYFMDISEIPEMVDVVRTHHRRLGIA